MSLGNVTIPIDEYERTKKYIEELNKRNVELTVELNAARTLDPTERVTKLNKLARDLIRTLQFSTSNLNPRDIKRWPFDAIRDVADGLPHLADCSPHDIEYATFLRDFADECEMWQKRRDATPEKEIPPPFPTEDHPIAQMVMGHPKMQSIEGNPGATLPHVDGGEAKIETKPDAS